MSFKFIYQWLRFIYVPLHNKFPRLNELHQKLFDTTPNNLHNSLNDILVTLRCYAMMTLKHDLNQKCNKFKTISTDQMIFG